MQIRLWWWRKRYYSLVSGSNQPKWCCATLPHLRSWHQRWHASLVVLVYLVTDCIFGTPTLALSKLGLKLGMSLSDSVWDRNMERSRQTHITAPITQCFTAFAAAGSNASCHWITGFSEIMVVVFQTLQLETIVAEFTIRLGCSFAVCWASLLPHSLKMRMLPWLWIW